MAAAAPHGPSTPPAQGNYVVELAKVLGDESKPKRARQLAGLNMKNAFDAKVSRVAVAFWRPWALRGAVSGPGGCEFQ